MATALGIGAPRVPVEGPAGRIDCVVDRPEAAPVGVVVVCHPHPLHGGSLDNKVVQTIARAFLQIGWASVRFDFRGVGGSEGAWGGGPGEVEDALAVIAAAHGLAGAAAGAPLALAGFSFGGWVAASCAERLPAARKPVRLVLVAPSTEKETVPAVPPDTVVVHGDADDTVPLAATLAWARPQQLPVVVLPGVGHFFHGQLGLLKATLLRGIADLAAPPSPMT